MQSYKISSEKFDFPNINDELEGTHDPKQQRHRFRKHRNLCGTLKTDWNTNGINNGLEMYSSNISFASVTEIANMVDREQKRQILFPESGNWMPMKPLLLENTAVGTTRWSTTSINSGVFERNKKERSLHENKSTITIWNGIMKKTKDASNFVVLCPKHMQKFAEMSLPRVKTKIYREIEQRKEHMINTNFCRKIVDKTVSKIETAHDSITQAKPVDNVRQNKTASNVSKKEAVSKVVQQKKAGNNTTGCKEAVSNVIQQKEAKNNVCHKEPVSNTVQQKEVTNKIIGFKESVSNVQQNKAKNNGNTETVSDGRNIRIKNGVQYEEHFKNNVECDETAKDVVHNGDPKVKSCLTNKNSRPKYNSTGTQVSFVAKPQAIHNFYNCKENLEKFVPRHLIPFENISGNSSAHESVYSWEDNFEKCKSEMQKNNFFGTPDDGLFRDLDHHPAQLAVNQNVFGTYPNKQSPKLIPVLKKTVPYRVASNYRNYTLCSTNDLLKNSTLQELPKPTIRNSSGTINYNENENEEDFISQSQLSKQYTASTDTSANCRNSYVLNKGRNESNSFITFKKNSIPPVFKDSVPKCSNHNQANCKNSVCVAKSSYLFRRHRYYEAIMDQVHYIKSRIKTLNFTLKDVEQLFRLIEKANEDIATTSLDSKEKLPSNKNKLKFEGTQNKENSNQSETQCTLDTIKQLEELFDTVLMNIEVCEKKFGSHEEQCPPENRVTFNTIELEEKLKEFERLRKRKKGWIREQVIQCERLQKQLTSLEEALQYM